jgi:hypothetical protein
MLAVALASELKIPSISKLDIKIPKREMVMVTSLTARVSPSANTSSFLLLSATQKTRKG